ncbi:hypothetical protein KHA96_06740 [Bacillus sp. FJAT-49711]|uniref:hypothetical protein n=1 Tax=Bacillus sp. FJAT-49711 TaxID=2833585 RepID=UPI001BCA23BE|nr:hypothetical protein [Bacillus sp. FJAT-49711]MBS4218019.1 hypothetical protein [Bacillus sp. FJAT-49711]
MKSAVVFGARQLLGYEFCVQLLEKGYKVLAKDFAKWQNKEQEEKWLFIGRNANLQYEQIEENSLGKIYEPVHYFFIPLPDFYSKDFPDIHHHFIHIIKTLTLDELFTQSIFVMIQPSAIDKGNSNFCSNIEKLKTDIRERGNKLIEYCMLNNNVNKKETRLFFNSSTNDKWRGLDNEFSSVSITKEIIEHIEKKMDELYI